MQNLAVPTFPILRGLMAKYGVKCKHLGELIGQTPQSISNKMQLHNDFTFLEMMKIWKYFNTKGESVTFNALFFDWALSNEEVSRKILK
jgi:hypothetical protein